MTAPDTSAAGVAYHVITQQTGHRSDQLLQRSMRARTLVREHVAARVGR